MLREDYISTTSTKCSYHPHVLNHINLCHLIHVHIVDYYVFPSFLLSVDLDCIHKRLQINQTKIAIPKLQFMTLALQGTSLKNTDAYNILKIKHHHQQTDDYYEFIAVQ